MTLTYFTYRYLGGTNGGSSPPEAIDTVAGRDAVLAAYCSTGAIHVSVFRFTRKFRGCAEMYAVFL